MRLIPDITQKMLTRQLRELEADGIVHRQVYPVVPPHVEYSLTEYGQSLKPILEAMCEWGMQHGQRQARTNSAELAEQSLDPVNDSSPVRMNEEISQI